MDVAEERASSPRPLVADNAVGGFPFAPPTLYRRQQFDRQGVREPPRHLFLCGEDVRVRAQALEGVCPEVSLVADLVELGVHTHALIGATHAPFQDVVDAAVAADFVTPLARALSF